MRASLQRTAIAVETGCAPSLFCYPVLSGCGRPACLIAEMPNGQIVKSTCFLAAFNSKTFPKVSRRDTEGIAYRYRTNFGAKTGGNSPHANPYLSINRPATNERFHL